MLIHVYAQRHGHKEKSDNPLDPSVSLTLEGRLKVIQQAQLHLAKIKFGLVISSGLVRTRQTADLAMCAIDHQFLHVDDKAFGFEYACNYPEFLDEVRMVEAAVAAGEPDTLALWLKHCPTAVGRVRSVVKARLLEMARMSALHYNGLPIYIASHSSVAEAAAPDPETTPTLAYGQICHYIIEIDGDKIAIVAFEEFPIG